MATIGLNGIWGLEQLDSTGIATWKLGGLLMAGGTLSGIMLILLLSYLSPVPLDESTHVLVILLIGFVPSVFLYVILGLSRTTESDMRLLALIDRSVKADIGLLRPKKGVLIPCLFLGVVVMMFYYFVVEYFIMDDLSVAEAFTEYFYLGSVAETVIRFILVPSTLGVTAGLAFAMYWSQSLSLTHSARHINIDLLQLSHYTNIASPLIRFIILNLLGIATLPFMVLLAYDNPAQTETVPKIVLVIVAVVMPLICLYAHPVLVLRNRIKEEKERELGIVFQALEGDDEATGRIKSRNTPPSIADLLTQRMFIESLWEWPVASHIQKLVFFGLLTPLAWVLAATIENVIY